MDGTRTLTLQKQGHTYLFRYGEGQEDQVIEELMMLADDRSSSFDWMDAASLSVQVTEYAAEGVMEHLKPDELAAE